MADNHQLEQEIPKEAQNERDGRAEEGGPSTGSSSLFKKRNKKISQNQIIRKRTIDSEPVTTTTTTNQDDPSLSQIKKSKLVHEQSNQEQQQPVVKFNRRKNQRNFNPLCQATLGSSKRSKADQSGSSSDEEEEDGEEDDDSKPRAVGVAYQAQGSARQQAEEAYQKAILEKRELDQHARQGLEPDQAEPEPGPDPKIYLGTSKSKYQLPKGSQKYGPIKGGPNNIKTITVVDYQPDVCKDYKETGYCGFGDTCKFLHDRGDYMHGWQLDDAFNSSRNKKTDGAESEEEEEEVPFACLICRQPFTDPIVTKCHHYFCSGCAIKRFAKTPKCFACGTPTGGIFNKASRIIEKMKAKQERIKRQKEERRLEEEGLAGIEGLETLPSADQALDEEEEGSERSFYEDE
ncbi:RNA-splicing factor [Puccinia graminis f. sp. tritici]|uniref:Pre-mRNA-splicing factor CWC24 n=2 Tax=Puccinia graminis f. sp. tritici TaxID=56615 RepID=E3JVB9_PUCGT|nr:uncharacterized protein PGTG_01325 [Puccinia graminis f. sp. tritici CRL 75-36-700-3]EFP75994.2 hypothetical protein PGTG_01325 [Puccinia graminis f. sp. tritici CRL 75-36-700-3]KAA1077303.1 RNA-splicing factor [Puccinia graminis f. sp. tritici]